MKIFNIIFNLMSRRLERLELPLTDRSHVVRKISQKSLIPDETLDRTLH